ncbi:MAG: response regulator [Anaerolineae bacterium]|jgi:DNA-binding response OmpR family regulator
MAEKVLVVEDEPTLVETLRYNLARQGYTVVTAMDGVTALELARREQPDLILLDIMLPELDGIEVCRILRQEMAVPIIMLTARDEEIDKVVGLEVGADDYITKPFSMRELLARVKANLRRVRMTRQESGSDEAGPEPHKLVLGDIVVDMGRREVLLRGSPVALTPREFELLAFLARNRGMVLSRDLILERVWGWDFAGGTRTVDVHIRGLREKLEDDPGHPSRIMTVRGAGYRLEA